MIVEGGKTWRGNWGRLAVCDRMQSHFTGFKYHREMVEQDILLGWQQRENGSRKGGKHPAYLLSSLSGTFSQVHQRGRFDWGRPSCPPSPVGCPLGLCCPPARWPPSTHCVFRAIGLAPCQHCGQLPVQLTGRHDHGGRLRNSQTSKISKVLSTLIPLSLSRLKLEKHVNRRLLSFM